MILKSCITTLLLFTVLNVNANERVSPFTVLDNISGNYIIFLSEPSALHSKYNEQGIDRRSIVKKVTKQQATLIKALKIIDNEIIISSQSKLLENSIHLQMSHRAANIIEKNTHVIKVKEVPYSQKLNFNSARQEKLSYRDHKEDTIAIVGNGVDYTHNQLGGSGKKSKYHQAKIIKKLNWKNVSNKTVVGGMNFYSLEKNPQDQNNNPLESYNLNVNEGFYPSGTVQTSLILEQAPHAKILAFKTIDWSWQQLYPALELVIDPNQDGIVNDSPDIMLVNFYGNNSFEYQRINKLVSNHIDKISSLNIAITASNNQTGALFSNAAPAEITISYSNVMLQRLFISKGIKAAVVGSGNETKNISLVNGYFAAYITGLIAKLKHDTPEVTIKELKASLGSKPLFNQSISEIALLPNG